MLVAHVSSGMGLLPSVAQDFHDTPVVATDRDLAVGISAIPDLLYAKSIGKRDRDVHVRLPGVEQADESGSVAARMLSDNKARIGARD